MTNALLITVAAATTVPTPRDHSSAAVLKDMSFKTMDTVVPTSMNARPTTAVAATLLAPTLWDRLSATVKMDTLSVKMELAVSISMNVQPLIAAVKELVTTLMQPTSASVTLDTLQLLTGRTAFDVS